MNYDFEVEAWRRGFYLCRRCGKKAVGLFLQDARYVCRRCVGLKPSQRDVQRRKK